MDKQALIDNRTAIETAFNALKDSVDEQEKAIAFDREELVRLQGEYRAVSKLVEGDADPATITAVEDKVKK